MNLSFKHTNGSKMKLATFFLLCLIITSQLAAQIENIPMQTSYSIKISGGFALPFKMESLKNGYRAGYDFGAGVDYNFGNYVSVEGTANYTYCSVDSNKFTHSVDWDSKKAVTNFSIFNIYAGLKVYFMSRVKPVSIYWMIGGGYSVLRANDNIFGASFSILGYGTKKENAFTAFGVKIGKGKVSYTLEDRFTYVFNDTRNDVSFMALRAGVLIEM
jgi:hypothetical protein